jgi:hypothetical protein
VRGLKGGGGGIWVRFIGRGAGEAGRGAVALANEVARAGVTTWGHGDVAWVASAKEGVPRRHVREDEVVWGVEALALRVRRLAP